MTDTLPLPHQTTSPLTGRIAVVTGASSGIGAALARRMVADGAQVALLARRADRLRDLAAALGPAALAVPADVTSAGDLDAARKAITAAFGVPDLVVANAGVMLPAPFEHQDTDEWHRMLDVDLLGVMRTARAFAPGLLEVGAEGRTADLVLNSSIAARQRFSGYAVYGAVKAGVTALAEALRLELSPRGVRVTNIEPGLVETELREPIVDADAKAALEEWVRATPPLSADEIADMLTFVVSRPGHVNVPQLTVLPTHQG